MNNTKWLGGFVALMGLTSIAAYAQPEGSSADWLRRYNLDIAEKYAAKARAHRDQMAAGVLVSQTPLTQALMGSQYHVGDQWDVIAFQNFNTEIAKGDAIRDGELRGTPAGFHYQVTSVNPLQIEVTQVSIFGLKIVDAEVASVTLKYDAQLKEISKTYHLADHTSATVAAGDLRNRLIPLEAYPIEIPNLEMASPEPATVAPALPGRMGDLGKKAGYAPDLAHSSWIEDDDLFGRAVEILWQKKTPWPSYLKTSLGMSILVRSSNSQGGV